MVPHGRVVAVAAAAEVMVVAAVAVVVACAVAVDTLEEALAEEVIGAEDTLAEVNGAVTRAVNGAAIIIAVSVSSLAWAWDWAWGMVWAGLIMVGVGAGLIMVGVRLIMVGERLIIRPRLPRHPYMSSARIWNHPRRNPITGITAEIRRVTIPTSKSAPKAGYR